MIPNHFARGQVQSVRRAFTLIELLVVITIVAVLVAIMAPSISAAREVALQVRCGAQLRQVGIPMMAYAYDHNEWAPFAVTWNCPAAYFSTDDNDWVSNYFPDGNILRCPTDKPFGASGIVGGKRWNNAVLSSYNILFGIGISYRTPIATDNRDVWYGWRCSKPDGVPSAQPIYPPLPRLTLLGRTTTYTRVYNTTVTTIATPNANEQPLAMDGWLPPPVGVSGSYGPFRNFYAAGPAASGFTPARVGRPVMHPFSDGLNVLYADGHVKWTKSENTIRRLKLVSGNSITLFW